MRKNEESEEKGVRLGKISIRSTTIDRLSLVLLSPIRKGIMGAAAALIGPHRSPKIFPGPHLSPSRPYQTYEIFFGDPKEKHHPLPKRKKNASSPLPPLLPLRIPPPPPSPLFFCPDAAPSR